MGLGNERWGGVEKGCVLRVSCRILSMRASVTSSETRELRVVDKVLLDRRPGNGIDV